MAFVGERGGVLTDSSVDMDDPSEDICVMDDSGRSIISVVSISRFFLGVGLRVLGNEREAVLP